MNRSYRIVPSYTGDVSGAASALFELGGMVVIHDPSGCNSTYNTHDEIRWYDQDSLIFISGLTQTEAILGDDEKLIREIEEAAGDLQPAFIALVSSPIPFMNGTDFPAIARLIEQDTGIPTFFVTTNGMHDYVKGAGNALAMVAKRLIPETVEPDFSGAPGRSVNILGVTPLDFAAEGSVDSLRKICEKQGWRVVSVWAMGSSLEELQQAPAADVNLVVSSVGYPAAEVLRQRFGIPWVVGCPVKGFAEILMEQLRRSAEDGICRIAYKQPKTAGESSDAVEPSDREKQRTTGTFLQAAFIGEPVLMGSLAAGWPAGQSSGIRCICPLEAPGELLPDKALAAEGEEEIQAALQDADLILADPLYRPISPADSRFVENPQLALSGRCYLKQMKNPVEEDILPQ